MVASGSGEYLQDLATQTASGGASAGAGAAQRAGMRVAPASGSFSGAADTAQDAAPPASQPATSNAGANKPDDTSVLADTSAVGKAGAASAPPAAEPTSPAAAAAKRAAAGVAAAPDAHLAPPLLPAAASTRRGRLPPLEVQGSEAESASGSEDVSPPAPRLSARASTLPAAATATAAAVAAGVRVRSAEEGAKRGSSQEATAAAPAMLNMTTSSLAVASEADAKGAAVASLHRPEDLLISPRFGSGAHSDCLFTMATGASRASEVAWIAGGFEGVDVDCASQPASQAPFLQPRPPAVPGAGARPSPSQPSQQQHIMPCRAGWSLDGRSSLRKLPSGYAGATASTGGGGGGAPPLASAHGMSCVLGNASNSGMPPSTFARATVGPSTSARASGILQLRQSMSGLCPVNEDQQHLHPLDTPMGTGGGGSSSTRLPPLLLATAMRSSARGSAAADAVASMLSGDLGSLGGSGSVGGSSNSCAPSASHLPWVLTPSGAPVLLGGGHHRRLPHQRPPPLVEPYVPPALGTYDSCAFPSGTLSGLLSGPLLSGVLPSGIFSTSGGADNGPGSFGLGPSLGSLHTYSPSAFHGRSSIPGSRGPVTPRGAGAGAGGAGGSGPGIGTRYVTQVAHLNSLADRMAVAQQSSASGGANSGPNSLLGLGQRPAPQTLSGPMTHWPVADGCVLEDSGVLLDCNSHHMRDGSPHAAALDPATIEHAAANAAAANYLATRRGSLHGAVGPHSSGNHAGSGPNNIGKYQTGSGPNSFGRHSVSGTPAVAGLAPGGSPADSQQLIFRVHSVHSAAAVGSNVAGASSGGVGGISASASVTGDYADQPSPFLLGMHSAGVSGAGSGSTHAAPNFSRMSSSNLEMQRSAGSGGMGSVGLLAPQPPSQPQQQSSSRFTRQSTTSVASSNHSVCSLRRGPSRLGQAPGSTAGGMNPSLRFALTRTTSHGLSSNTASASGLDGGDALTSVAVLLHTRSSYNCATYCSASMDGSGAAAGGSVGAVAGAAASGSGMVSGTMSDCGGVEGVGAPSPELDLQQGQRSAPIRGRALKIGGSPDPYDVMELMLTDPLADPRKAAATAAVAAAAEAAVTSMAADAAAAAARRAHAYSAAGMWPAEDRSAVATQSSPRAGAGWATFVAEADAQAQPEGLNHVLVSIDEMAGSATTLVRVGELGMARRPTSLANMHAASPILLGGLMPGDDGTPAPIPAGSGHSSIAMHGGGDIDRACNSRRSVVSIASAVLATPYSFTLQPPGVAGGAQGATTGSEVSGAAAGANDEAALVGPSGDADSGAYAPLSGLYTTSRLSMGAATAEDEAVAAAAKRRASSSGVNTFSRLASGFRKKVEKLKKVLS
ncbi:hypothetical protein HYH02_006044 [Chlamydomonas schloesseri]|nr:hypothetical protein HYH02_006044 [Chlamydomonas schloesseri]|eukprot:KAG2448687.1 hypothetical protein HYH02_006044 [Chlamydomonas schloesseri]